MENERLKDRTTTDTPTEDELFRQKILNLRSKLRLTSNQGDFTSSSEGWETEDEDKMKLGQDSSSSSESSDSEHEDPKRSVETVKGDPTSIVDDSLSAKLDQQNQPDAEQDPEAVGDNLIRIGRDIRESSSSSSEDEGLDSVDEDPPGTVGHYDVTPPDADTSDDEGSDHQQRSRTSSSSSSNDENDLHEPAIAHPMPANTLDNAHDNFDAEENPVTTGSQPNEEPSTNEPPISAASELAPPSASSLSSSSSSSSESEGEDDNPSPLVIRGKDENIDDNELTPLSLRKALEEREKELKLKREEEENLAELGARKPSEPASVPDSATPDFMESYSPEAFDFTGDPSIRARTAFDFEETPPQDIPPALPPKQRDMTPPEINVNRQTHDDNVPDKTKKTNHAVDVHPNIFHVKDKIASLGRGMWSDEDDESEPSRKNNSMPGSFRPADRVIDFSYNPDGDHSLRRSRSRNKSGRRRNPSNRRQKENRRSKSRSPSASGHRVLDFSGSPYENPHDAVNTQALVSLHSNTFDTDAYDSVQDTGDELNVLINKANSLGYHHNQLQPSEDIYQKTKPKEKRLESKHPEAFAKIVAPISSKPPLIIPPQKTSDHPSSDNSRRPSRSQPRRKRKVPPPAEGIDGDDETSVAESEIHNHPAPPPTHIESSIPFVTEIYPSDYTEFESYSEPEFAEPKKLEPTISFTSDNTIQELYNPALGTAGESAYDTVPDNDMETDTDVEHTGRLNPIVSSNFQICSDISGSKSFPSRLRDGKPKKPRPVLDHVAIPLNQASKNRQAYPTSLPYFGTEFDSDLDGIHRTGSADDVGAMYPVSKPSIVVHRQPMHPSGYNPEVVPTVLVQGAPTTPMIPPKKEKKKKEKKEKKDANDKTVPQINLKVEPADGESSNINNNLQINLLPSDDPNVINLNIRSSSVNASGPQSLPPQPTEIFMSHQAPITNQPASIQPDNQRRVVEVSAPPFVLTGDELPPVGAPYSNNGGIMLAGGVPTTIIPPTTSVPQMPPYPTLSLNQSPQFPPPLPATQSLPMIASAPQPSVPLINTHISTPPAPQITAPPQSEPMVVNINQPEGDNRANSLPTSTKSSGRINRGDSGIDLTMHDGNRRSRRNPPRDRRRRSVSRSSVRRSSSSVSSDRGSRHRRRSSSRKKLRSHDYLGGTTPTREYMEWYKDKYLKPSCCYIFMKHLVLALNLIFTIAGLALVGLGIWGMVRLHQNGFYDPNVIFLDPLAIVMIIGFITTLVAFHGAAGFIRDSICMIKCFGAFLITLFLLFVVGGIVFWVKLASVEQFTVHTYRELIKQYDTDTREGLSYSLDLMQETFQCCGIADHSDWYNNEFFICPNSTNCQLPDSCCMDTMDETFKCASTSALKYHQPCNVTMANAVRDNTPIIVGGWICIWAVMMMELVIIYFMCKEIRYLQKVRSFVKDPVKYMQRWQRKSPKANGYDESSDESSDESESETSSSEEDYRKKRAKRKGRKRKRGANKKDARRRSRSNRRRQEPYHINRSFSIQDEKFHRRSQRDYRRNRRSRSRRRDSY